MRALSAAEAHHVEMKAARDDTTNRTVRRGFFTDGRAVTKEAGGGLGGEIQRSTFALKTLEIAGVTLRDVAAALDDGDSATETISVS